MSKVSFVVAVSLVFSAFGCASAEDASTTASDGAQSSTSSSNLSGAASRECTLDTFMMADGFLADLKSAVDPANIHNYGGTYYPHVEVPGFLDAALPPVSEGGEFFYTIVGFNFGLEELPTGSKAKPRFVATLEAGPVPASLPFAAKQYAAAKGIFTALTRAKETTEHHVAPKSSYDRSWDKVTRTSAGGRVVCTSTVYPGSGETRPTYACSFFDFQRNMVQTFDTKDAGGKCIAK